MRTEFYEYEGWMWRNDYIQKDVLITKIKLWELAPRADRLLEEI
jgi:hypothetical protein